MAVPGQVLSGSISHISLRFPGSWGRYVEAETMGCKPGQDRGDGDTRPLPVLSGIVTLQLSPLADVESKTQSSYQVTVGESVFG